ncbi:MAG: hypothetical protein J5725_00375 [Bacteroidales bacterium]|nr:hypothetical protein [Bacteroidales bacterium]
MRKVMTLFVALAAMMFTSCKKEFVIIVLSNNEEWGLVAGSGVYAKGSEISIEAIAKSGYKFVSWQDGNTENPRTITVKNDVTYIATFVKESGGGGGEEPNLAVFSVSATQKVYFSPGNLQWSAEGTHAVIGGGNAAGTWRFAPNQWDTIGANNSKITGWIDLFGWGTSGYNNKYPSMTGTTSTDYGNGENDISGTNYDWGIYNAIYHPKTKATDAPGTWRTLTTDEWEYLLETRPTLSGIRYAKAIVCGIAGLIIVPDNFVISTNYQLTNVNTSGAAYTTNIIGASDWSNMEAVGCVFLPAAGYRRYGTWVDDVGSSGNYWSATYNDSDLAYGLFFLSSFLYPSGYDYRDVGKSVRLVRDVK